MSLADYLAKNYLNADPSSSSHKKSKKRKRQHADTSEGLKIADDDDTLGWSRVVDGEDDDDLPTTVAGHSSEFRKAKKSTWKRLDNGEDQDASAAAAAIIASTAAENAARAAADDDAPDIIDEDGTTRMDSGARAGLQTAAQVAADIRARRKAEQRDFERTAKEHSGAQAETIYRDASGRVVNLALKRSEAARAAAEAARKEKEEKEAQRGDVQRAEREKRREDLEEAKFMKFARGADDEGRNEELKAVERWNDPAAQFLTERKKKGKSASGKKLYQGAAPPNRYGIRPGHRWDGVDRGNGFERKYFAAQNRRQHVRDRDYAWQMDE